MFLLLNPVFLLSSNRPVALPAVAGVAALSALTDGAPPGQPMS
jgi:hypothetical protein